MNNDKRGHACLFWLSGFAVCGIDLFSKHLAKALPEAESIPVLGGIVLLKRTQNPGVAFGMLGSIPVLSYVLPVLFVLGFWLYFRQYRLNRLQTVLIGMIAGGFAGNFIDRLIHGSVTDFLFFRFLPWFICNLADVFVVLCAVWLIVYYIACPKSWVLKKEDEPDA